MDELTFRVIYAVFGAVFVGALLFLFSRKLDRKTYLAPVIVGFLFATVTSVIVGGGILSFLLGGILTGYLLKDVTHWSSLFRAGGLNATLVLAALFIPNTMVLIGNVTYGLFTSRLSDMLAAIAEIGAPATAEDLLYFLIGNYISSALLVIAFAAIGAILGGYMHKVIKPAAKKIEEPKKQAE
ncbi:MAG: hypothetical protein ABH852_04035 [Methanobacteriota archaeon]